MMSDKEWAVLGVIGVVFAALLLIFGEPKTEIVEVERGREIYIVTATVYHAVEGQCDDSPLVTASGARISSTESAYEHRYLAVSRDLLDVFPYGTKVEVSGCGELNGEYIVADTMNRRYKGYIDILINHDMKRGKWEGARIRKVNSKNEQSKIVWKM